MTRRLVVCLRWRPGDQDAGADAFATAAASVVERVATLGGRLILWHPEWLCVDFAIEGLQDAIDFIVDRPHEGFSIGFAYGLLHEVVDGGPMLAACLGPVIESAMALARMARAGDVLVEPGLVKASGGELLVHGARVATIGTARVRGFKLDLAHPQRSLECESVARLLALPPGDSSPVLETKPGALSVLCAAQGGGGSRALEAHRRTHHPECLLLTQNVTGVPLGALRQALTRDRTLAQGSSTLSAAAQATWRALSHGAGCSHEAGAALLGEWVRLGTERAILYIEDVGQVDFDSLEVVAHAVQAGELGAVVLAERDEPLPEPLSGLEVYSTFTVPEMNEAEAVSLLLQMTGEELAADWAERLAARGLPLPLGVIESLVESLDSASFLWTDAGVVPRVPREEMPKPEPALMLVRRRLSFVESTERLLLEAVAVLGGRAERARVVELLKLAGRGVSNTDAAFAFLERLGWIALEEPEGVALKTRTHRSAIVASLSDKRFRALHQAAATLAVDGAEPLGFVSAALHAGLAGNVGKATLLARRAIAPLLAAGLELTAHALEEFAATSDLALLSGRGLSRIERSLTAEDQGVEASSSVDRTHGEVQARATLPAEAPVETAPSAGRGGAGWQSQGGSETLLSVRAPVVPEPAAPSGPRASEASSPTSSTASSVRSAPEPGSGLERDPVPDSDLEAMSSADDSELKPASEEPEGDIQAVTPDLSVPGSDGNGAPRALPTLRVAGVPSNDSLMPERASLALQRGDPVTLDQLARQLRSEAHNMLADRLDAMASLVRGNTGDALRRLRDAKHRARQLSLSEQCRASLALSVAIAAAGRPTDALLETLEGLALARRGGDLRGERACAKFLAQLAHKAGQEPVALAWQTLSASPSLLPATS